MCHFSQGDYVFAWASDGNRPKKLAVVRVESLSDSHLLGREITGTAIRKLGRRKKINKNDVLGCVAWSDDKYVSSLEQDLGIAN